MANNSETLVDTECEYVEHDVGSLQFSAYHFHHNRVPFYILYIRKDNMIYIEKIDEHSHRNKYVNDVVMPFDVMEKCASLKKYYDMSVMLVNTDKTIYYDTNGLNSKSLISTYDTDSEDDDEDEESDCEEGADEIKERSKSSKSSERKKKEKVKRPIRNWCINSDIVWKNLRVSKPSYYNCYYNINPFTYEYNASSDIEINQFIHYFECFAKYNNIPTAIEEAITANYNYYLRLIRN